MLLFSSIFFRTNARSDTNTSWFLRLQCSPRHRVDAFAPAPSKRFPSSPPSVIRGTRYSSPKSLALNASRRNSLQQSALFSHTPRATLAT